MGQGFAREGHDKGGEADRRLGRGVTAEEPQIQCDLVVARTTRVQRSAGGRDLGEPALDRRVDVLICRSELERAFVELPLDPAKSALDRRRLGLRQQTCRRKTSSMREAARDVVRIELVVHLE